MSLGERIKQRREHLRLSQQELAARARMRQNIISRLEHGDTPNPGADVLKRLAIALRCSVDWLLEMYDDAPDDISSLLPACASP
jgi:transcriptional regulator with XRE-family HTH domain